jgi:FMN reductase
VGRTVVFAASEDWGAGDVQSDSVGARITRAGEELAELVLQQPSGAKSDDALVPFERQLTKLRSVQ